MYAHAPLVLGAGCERVEPVENAFLALLQELGAQREGKQRLMERNVKHVGSHVSKKRTRSRARVDIKIEKGARITSSCNMNQ